MVCPQCSYTNSETSVQCVKCATPLPLSDQTLATGGEGWSVPAGDVVVSPTAVTQLNPGSSVGTRYEIIRLLGQGGMGAVYQAYDRELERQVALKVIRSDMAANPEILKRFKQELILSRQITHKDVIRIFDLGQAEGIKFITMEYIEGEDLQSLLRQKKKLEPAEAATIVAQVCRALEAAHAEGVIHRDLKPQNIMLDKKGHAYVMDFGIARSMLVSGMTQTGALISTPDYMSPEQAKGQTLDARSDLFSVGIIFYEILGGRIPFESDTTMGKLWKRTNEPARPLRELDATIPTGLSDIVSKCLERDLNLRYQRAQEILADLDAWQGNHPISASVAMQAPVPQRVIPWKWIAAGTMAVIVVVGGWMASSKFTSKTASNAPVGPEVSLAILPFRNGSGDARLDWLGPSLADMLSTDVGQSAHLRTISPDRLHQVLSDLRITPHTTIDPTMVGRIAEFSNADTVVWGQFVKIGDQIRIDGTLRDLKHQRTIPVKAEAQDEKGLLPAVAQLAQSIQKNLSLSSDVLQELRAKSFQPSSTSLQALRDYNEGAGASAPRKSSRGCKAF